jgi:hypothetical protein
MVYYHFSPGKTSCFLPEYPGEFGGEYEQVAKILEGDGNLKKKLKAGRNLAVVFCDGACYNGMDQQNLIFSSPLTGKEQRCEPKKELFGAGRLHRFIRRRPGADVDF